MLLSDGPSEHTLRSSRLNRTLRLWSGRPAAARGGGHTLFHPDDLPMDLEALPDIFTQFRKKVEKHSEVGVHSCTDVVALSRS